MKYFKDFEFVCDNENCYDKMDKSFLVKLDEARGLSNSAYTITSSWRSLEHNKAVGGSPTSSHLKGLAVDIDASNSIQKFNIVTSLLGAGFTRIGIGSNFIHVDSDESKYQNLIWTY